MIRTKCPINVLSLSLLMLHLISANACHKIEEKEEINSQPPSELLTVLNALKNHVEGVTILSPGQIEANKLFIDSQKKNLGSDQSIIRACFDLVGSYDKKMGPLWIARGEFDRKTVANDIHWTIYHVMQYIMDEVYTGRNILNNESLFKGFKFGSSAHFPGAVDPPVDPDFVYSVKINGSFPKTFGRITMHFDRPARKPTGAYLAPGTIATVTVPPSIAGKGYQVRVGAHSWDLTEKPKVRRLDRVSLVFNIDSTTIKIASPLGGGIYIEVPYLADAGIVEVKIRNAVRSPYFSAKSFHRTSLSEWQNTERKHKAPWADFQSEKFLMQVPTSWIYNLEDPVSLMKDWDSAMDAMNDLMGFPHDRGKETMYPQVDIILRTGVYAPGYPSVNAIYNPSTAYGGYHTYHLVRGPQYAIYYEFHEQGHAYLFPKFPDETESNVNLLHVAVWHRKFGYSLDEAFRRSLDQDIPFQTLDNTAVCWMMCLNFKEKKPMVRLEKQYQMKGHAKFVEIARLYGWEVLGKYWKSFNDDYERGVSSATDIDNLLLRLSKSTGYDITPLFHFWGVHPVNAYALKNAIASEKIPESPEIYNTLVKYKSLVPANKKAFQDFAFSYWGKKPSTTDPDNYLTLRDHEKLWDTYDETYADLIKRNVQEVIDRYFPNGKP